MIAPTDRSLRTPIERIEDHIARLRDGAFDARQMELEIGPWRPVH